MYVQYILLHVCHLNFINAKSLTV